MTQLNKSFFIDNEVLFWDQTKNGVMCPISKMAYQTLIRHGIKVQSVGSDCGGGITELNALPKIPPSAYVLYERNDEEKVVRQLIENGVKHILFHVLAAPSPKILKECKENSIETVIGCPMMIVGTPICKLHALFC